jgi:hypothetical protein
MRILFKLNDKENDMMCLQSEECAMKWMDMYNFIYLKVNERGAVVKVR